MSPQKTPIAFIHGLWMHAESWTPWLEFFRSQGYEARALSWPGDAESTEATRREPELVAGYGVNEIADHLRGQIERSGGKPILIGHSFGGLLVQNLLGRDLGVAGIAIDPAPIQGVPELPASALRATFPIVSNPGNLKRAVSLTEAQFRYSFTNAVSEQEAHDLYVKYAMPAPARPLFQAATATFNPNSATKVNRGNNSRGPLLLIAGLKDNTVPPVLVRSTLRAYRKSSAVTEYKEFENRGHSLVIDSGWRELAEYCLSWLQGKGF